MSSMRKNNRQNMEARVIPTVKLQMVKADPKKETKKELTFYEEYWKCVESWNLRQQRFFL